MTTTAAHRQRRFLLSLLTLLTLVGAIGLGPTIDASASTHPAAQTRVRAIDYPAPVSVAAVDLGSSTPVEVSSVRLRQLVSATGVATNSGSGLADDAVLVRGGTNTPDRFAGGSGVSANSAGKLDGVSVNSGRTIEEAAQGIPNNQVGVSTAGEVRSAGGTVRPDPTPRNPGHCLIGGLTAEQMSDLFTPTIKNPCK